MRIWREMIEAAPEKMFPRILERFRSGASVTGVGLRRGLAAAARRCARSGRTGSPAADAVILPTAPILPPDANRLMTDDAYYVTENLLALRNTRIGNLMGVCALTLPTGEPSCGISLMGPAGGEAAAAAAGGGGGARAGLSGKRAKKPQFSACASRCGRRFSGPQAETLAIVLRKRGDTTPGMRQ